MEDKDIREIFNSFAPPLSDREQFMSRLEANMRAVEMVKEENRRLRSINRKALIIAFAVGFSCGFLFSLLLPWIGESIEVLRQNVTTGSWASICMDNYLPIVWTLIAAVTAVLSINAFEVSSSLLRSKNKI